MKRIMPNFYEIETQEKEGALKLSILYLKVYTMHIIACTLTNTIFDGCENAKCYLAPKYLVQCLSHTARERERERERERFR